MKIKYDLSGSNPDDARARGSFEQPKPGVYRFKIIEVNDGFSKDGAGKQNRKRPRVEIVFSCLDARYPSAQVWEYLPTVESEVYDEIQASKWDQLLQAVGFTDGKKNRKGENLDSDKHIKGKIVKVRVRSGKNQDDEYKADFGSVFPDDGEGGDDELMSEDEITEDEITEEIEEEEVISDEYDEDARRAELSALVAADLKPICAEVGVKASGKKADVVEAIIEAEKAALEAPEEEEEEIIEEEIIEEEDAPSNDEYLTEDQLNALSPKEVVEMAKQFDLSFKKGTTKGEAIKAILEAQAAPADDSDEPLPF